MGELTIITSENAGLIMRDAPAAYQNNITSHNKCLVAGSAILERIQAEGMNDELDQQAALFIERARKTVKKMNEGRSPITKLMDEYRKVFTSLENDIDVTKAGTVPAQLQALRNAYAAKKREEEERRRAEEVRRIQAENDRRQLRADIDAELLNFYTAVSNNAFNDITTIFSGCTLENYSETESRIREYSTVLPQNWHSAYCSTVRLPMTVSREDAAAIRAEAVAALEPQYKERYVFEVESQRDDCLNRLPSKRRELEAIGKVCAEEAERRRAEIAAREQAEAARREEERRRRDEAERSAKEFAVQADNMDGLFGAAAADNAAPVADPTYQPKTSVKVRINVLNSDGYAEIFGWWWQRAGRNMTKEELDKMFKAQITYCEKLANDKVNPVRLQSANVEYKEEVKAR